MQMDKLLLVTHQISETSYGTVQDSNALEGGGGGGQGTPDFTRGE